MQIYYLIDTHVTNVVRKAVLGMMAMKRMTTLASHLTPEQRALEQDIFKYKEESEKVRFISTGPILLLTCPCSTGVDGEHCRPAPSQPGAPRLPTLTRASRPDEESG